MKRASRSLNKRATIPISKESRSKQAKAKGQGKKNQNSFHRLSISQYENFARV
jgi:hypothetical protein